jgi:hypothetical protein
MSEMSAKTRSPARSGAGGSSHFECPICLDDFSCITKSNSVTCGCGRTICMDCAKQYLLSTPDEPHCFECKRVWDRTLQYELFGCKFINKDYRDHLKTRLFNQERLRLPETVAIVAAEKAEIAAERARIAERQKIRFECDSAGKEFNQLLKKHRSHSLYRKSCELNARKITLKNTIDHYNKKIETDNIKIINMEKEIRKLRENISQSKKFTDNSKEELKEKEKEYDEVAQVLHEMFIPVRKARTEYISLKRKLRELCVHKKMKTEKRIFTVKCSDETCKGFLSEKEHQCGICAKYACSKCHEMIGTNKSLLKTHECDPDKVATVKMLKKETRPCPKCVAPIYKISGCDQMWCTQCHVAFSWETGKIVTKGRLHNPHYYQYIRENGPTAVREPEEIVCGGISPFAQLENSLRLVVTTIASRNRTSEGSKLPIPSNKDLNNIVCSAHRYGTHIADVELPPLRRAAVAEDTNLDLRKRYLGEHKYSRQTLTEKEFKTRILTRHNKKCKDIEVMRVLEVANTVLVENFSNFHQVIRDKTEEGNILMDHELCVSHLFTLIDNLKSLRKFINQQLIKISEQFVLCVPLITNSWEITRINFVSSVNKVVRINKRSGKYVYKPYVASNLRKMWCSK